MKKAKRIVSLLMVLLLAIGMTLTTGCSKKSDSADSANSLDSADSVDSADSADDLVVTVGDNKIYMNEMMYYIYAVESTGAYYDQSYQQYYGSSYWDMEYSEGVTMRDQTKSYVMDTAIMYEILYDKAVAAGYSMTDEEKTTNQSNTDEILTSISEEQLKITGFTEEILLKTQEKLVVGEKYYTELVEGFDIDDKAITAGIKYEDNRQYETEYLFIPTSTYDANSQIVALSDADKKTALASITAALEKVKAGEEFSAITEADATITTSPISFVYGDTSAETAYQDAAIALENDDYTTKIVETDLGYYIIKMLDNKSTVAYDEAVAAAITAAEEEAFNAEYEIIKKDYATTINTAVWDTIIMGETTLVEAATTDASTTDASTTDASTTDAETTDTETTDTTDTTEE